MKKIMCAICLLMIIYAGGCWYDSFGYDPFGNPSPEEAKRIQDIQLSENYQLTSEEIESVPPRFRKSYTELPLFREYWKRHIDNPLIIGMSQTEVREKWGEPSDISIYTSTLGTYETWEYGELDSTPYGGSVYVPPDAILYFQDGILVSIYEP